MNSACVFLGVVQFLRRAIWMECHTEFWVKLKFIHCRCGCTNEMKLKSFFGMRSNSDSDHFLQYACLHTPTIRMEVKKAASWIHFHTAPSIQTPWDRAASCSWGASEDWLTLEETPIKETCKWKSMPTCNKTVSNTNTYLSVWMKGVKDEGGNAQILACWCAFLWCHHWHHFLPHRMREVVHGP